MVVTAYFCQASATETFIRYSIGIGFCHRYIIFSSIVYCDAGSNNVPLLIKIKKADFGGIGNNCFPILSKAVVNRNYLRMAI